MKTRLFPALILIVLLFAACDTGGGADPASDPGTLVEMVSVTGGSFTMGDATDATEVHTVNLSGFRIGKYEVTQAQYLEVVGSNPSQKTGNTAMPVDTVSWFDAVEFCNLLSEREGLTSVYSISGRTPASGYPITDATVTATWTNDGYRLPTEAEWEYAARGGHTGTYTYSGSNTVGDVAYYQVNSGNTSHPVGELAANELGLYDLSGNISEWCWDWYEYTYASAAVDDPKGPGTPDIAGYRIMRGGDWANVVDRCRVFDRNGLPSGGANNTYGFRVARNAP